MFRFLRIVLFPFSLLYGLIIVIRNFLFDTKVFKSVSFNLPVIAIGNLSAGGTGKSPMVEYLLRLLEGRYKVATLSRGYKRKTKGYILAVPDTNALEIGDEPMQFHRKFPEVAVAVGEERILAVPMLLKDRPDIDVVILDDAFQHRAIKAGLNILLTEYEHLFTRDYFLPAGNLRDQRSSYRRADLIVVTKCPEDVSKDDKSRIIKEIAPERKQHVFFTSIQYGRPYQLITSEEKIIDPGDEVLLVCGIADPAPLQKYLALHAKQVYQLSFSDHHHFTDEDVKEIRRKFDLIETKKKLVMTTEKDAARLLKYSVELSEMPLFVIPVSHHFLFGEGAQFDNFVHTFIKEFQQIKNKHE